MHVKSELTREVNEHKVKKVLICTDICCELLYNSMTTDEIRSLYWISQWSALQSFWENKICWCEIYSLPSKSNVFCTWLCGARFCQNPQERSSASSHPALEDINDWLQTYPVLSTKTKSTIAQNYVPSRFQLHQKKNKHEHNEHINRL